MSTISKQKRREEEALCGKEEIIKCNICNNLKLMKIWVTRPQADYDWKIRAKCPDCGILTPILNVHGLFHYGIHTDLLNPGDKYSVEDKETNLMLVDMKQDEEKEEVIFILQRRKND